MNVTIFVPGPLRPYCGNAARLAGSGATVGAVLADLETRLPALYAGVCDETGAVRRHINIFVNDENVKDREGLETPVADGDEVFILPAVSGG